MPLSEPRFCCLSQPIPPFLQLASLPLLSSSAYLRSAQLAAAFSPSPSPSLPLPLFQSSDAQPLTASHGQWGSLTDLLRAKPIQHPGNNRLAIGSSSQTTFRDISAACFFSSIAFIDSDRWETWHGASDLWPVLHLLQWCGTTEGELWPHHLPFTHTLINTHTHKVLKLFQLFSYSIFQHTSSLLQ